MYIKRSAGKKHHRQRVEIPEVLEPDNPESENSIYPPISEPGSSQPGSDRGDTKPIAND